MPGNKTASNVFQGNKPMNKIKFITALFAAAAALLLEAAPKFSIKASAPKSIYQTGEKVEFDLTADIPEDHQLRAWYVMTSKSGSPAGYTAAWDKWGSARLGKIRWIKAPSPEKKSIHTAFDLENLTPGDYNFAIVAIVYNVDKSKKEKFISTRLHLTLEAPDAPAAATAAFSGSFKNVNLKTAKNADNTFSCSFNAVLSSSADHGSCFRVRTFLSDAAGNISEESEEIIGIRGKSDLPVKFRKTIKTPGEYRLNIELWNNRSQPVMLKSFSFPVAKIK